MGPLYGLAPGATWGGRRHEGLAAMSDLKLEDQEIVDADAVELPGGKESGGRGTVITLTTVISLLAATALTVLGLGAADTAVTNFDASSWVWSSGRSEVERVNGVTARVDTRAKIKDSQNHEIQITQTDKYLILRDLETGQVTALDLTTLQVSAVMPSTPGFGVSVALHGDAAFVIDSVLGQVRQLDPRTLSPSGDPITLPKGLTPGGFDGKGLLWIAVPSEGTVVSIQPGSGGASPKVVRTVSVASPGHDFELSALDDGVAVLDNTVQKLSVVGESVQTVDIPIDKPGIMPDRTVGTPIAITVADDRIVVLVDGTNVQQLKVPGTGPVGAAVAYAGHVYTPNSSTGVVHETDTSGKLLNDIKLPSTTGKVELEVRENYLFINSPDGSNAKVVNDQHVVREVNKYQDGVLGGDPLPPPPQPTQAAPPIGPPGLPQAVTASAGNASATVTWRKASDNGSPVLRYVVEGFGAPIVVGASQRSVDITGLTNGTSYRFSVYAENAKGRSGKAFAPPVIPTSDVPDPPASVTATANPDGTVTVTWPAANGQGRAITSYRVTSITGGVTAPVGAVTTTSMVIARGGLPFGTQFAFTVVSINNINAASTDSPVSNTVIPFTTPGAPVGLTAATVPNQRGAIQVNWGAAPSNGRPITKYEVEKPDGTITDVTAGTTVTLNGFPDDTAITVKVRAVNLAGNGPDGTTSARTIGAPSLTVTGSTPNYNSISVTLTPNNRGGASTCSLAVAGAGTVSAACANAPVTLTVGGLWPNNTYSYTVSITNPVGSASANGTQASNQMRFTVVCPNNTGGYCNSGIWAYQTPSQQGTADSPAMPVGATGIPECHIAGNRVINATPWGGKSTDQWVRFQHSGTAYFPWAWSALDGGDNLNMIPPC
jgi:Fibronectin type III domain